MCLPNSVDELRCWTGVMHVELELVDLEHAAAVRLIAELDEEIRARYDEPIEDLYLSLDPDEMTPGRGVFALESTGREAVGCGGVRLLDVHTVELKRMYVRPEYRRRGVAAAMLEFLETHARALGASRVVLETVTGPPAATALYRAAGYGEIPKFGPYVESEISFCMGKAL